MYTVLIVDDEPMALNLIRLAFNWKDYHFSSILTTTSPNEALHILETRRVDIALVDISMPEMSGLELIQNSKNRGICTRFIIISAYSEFDYARSAVKLGVMEYCLKPIHKDSMMPLLSLKKEAYLAHKLSDRRFRNSALKESGNPDVFLTYLGLTTQAQYYHMIFLSSDFVDEYEKICNWLCSDEIQMFFTDESIAVFICGSDTIPERNFPLSCNACVIVFGLTKSELMEIMIHQLRDISLLLLNEDILFIDKLSLLNEIFIKILDYVQRNYQKDISLTMLANKFNINYSYCSCLFKEATGITYSSYIKCLRMRHALNLLSHSDLTVSQIAYESGFKDSHYFNNSFKKLTGVTPSQYRQESRSRDISSQSAKNEHKNPGVLNGGCDDEAL